MKLDWLPHSGVLLADGWQPDVQPHTAGENPAFFKAAMQVQLRAGARVLRPRGPAAVRLCRELGTDGVVLWATLGPSGKLLPLKEVEPEELGREYEPRIAELAEAGPDALWIEGLSDVEEAALALQAARRVAGLPVGVSLVFGGGAEGMDTVLGLCCDEAAACLEQAGADWVGASCQLPIDEMVLAVRLMSERVHLPIAAFPDAAQRELDGSSAVHRETPEEFAAKAPSLAGAGARIIGGCCGVTSEHIQALSSVLSARD